jgi:cytochrome c oxidase subunit 3
VKHDRGVPFPRAPIEHQRTQVISSAALGMLIFVLVEAMMFAGMISAFMIVQTASIGQWPPPGQPRLPIEETAFNTLALLVSGVLLAVAHREFQRGGDIKRWLSGSILLGAFFVAFQGFEWVALIREGLTLTSSNHGSFFYLIVGAHALHAVGALGLLGHVWLANEGGRLEAPTFHAAELFWYFVVLLWPILYLRVYL